MESIFTGRDQVDNLRKSFEKLGVNADDAIQELAQQEKDKYQLRAKSSCRQCWGTGNIRMEEEVKEEKLINLSSGARQYETVMVPQKNRLVDKLCHCVKVKKRK